MMTSPLSDLALALAFMAFVCLAASCATTGVITDSTPDQDAAVSLVWHDVYGRSDRPPRIAWHTKLDCLTSTGARGFSAPAWGSNGCVAGITEEPMVVHVALSPGQRWSDTSLAHELMHATHMRLVPPVFDPYHKRPEWDIEVPRANQALKERGW